MTDQTALSHDETAALVAAERMSVSEMIGELLAWTAHYFERRLGGPGALRRLLSILVAFASAMTMMAIRRRATARRVRILAARSPIGRHLSHPPAGWAAP